MEKDSFFYAPNTCFPPTLPILYTFSQTYFKLESIFMSIPTKYHIELGEKYYDNKYIDYHSKFFRAVIKKWLNNSCKETPEEITEIITSEYKNHLFLL